MDCIYAEYIKFVDDFLMDYYKLLLDSNYDRNLVKPFVNRFIDVRYYNKYSIDEKDFTKRLNKELNSVAKELLKDNPKKAETIKNIFALFSYVLYIDGCTHFSNVNSLLKALYEDDSISLEYSSEAKKNVNDAIKDYIKKKVDFFRLFESSDFYLKGKKYQDNIYHIDLGQKCSLPRLYSDFAIKKAYNSEVVLENRTFLTILMVSSKILFDVLELKYDDSYIIDLPPTLFEKPKKLARITSALKDEFIKEKISLRILYSDYKANKRAVHELINQGYSLSLELDDSYNTDFENLFLFSNIIIDKKHEYYDIINNNRDVIKTNIIIL